jgi:hypothetical protein
VAQRNATRSLEASYDSGHAGATAYNSTSLPSCSATDEEQAPPTRRRLAVHPFGLPIRCATSAEITA